MKSEATFKIVDLATYPRRSHYEVFRKKYKCRFSVTAKVDITKLLGHLKTNKIKFYPAFIFLVTRVLNEIDELKMSVNERGQLGIWSYLHPSYTLFREESKTFTGITTQWSEDFATFFSDYQKDNIAHENVIGLNTETPSNNFYISSLPWLDFENIDVEQADYDVYNPQVSWSKWTENDGKYSLSLNIKVHHATTDGYHVSLFFNRLRDLCGKAELLKLIITK